MTCHEISCRDEICRLNLVLSESQVGNRDTAGLLGIIAEISLCVQIRIIADNLNRTLIRAYGTVRAQNIQRIVPSGSVDTPSTEGRDLFVTSSMMPMVKSFTG